MIVAVTGSRRGMSPRQRVALSTLLRLWDVRLLVHGDCVGVDEQADAIAARLGIDREFYPGSLERFRAHRERVGARQVREPEWPARRNAWIVRAGEALIALPRPESRGTWDAVRKARAIGRPVVVIGEDGCAS